MYLKKYPSPEPTSSEKIPSSGSAGGGGHLLVNRCISQRSNSAKALLVYPSAVKIVRDHQGKCSENVPPGRTDIQGFSDHSRRRLRFLAGNPSIKLISQFCLTYHKTVPDGHTIKKHLNSWLTRLRSRFPGVGYLWVLEFQTRGVPHFHVWISLPHDLPGLRNILAKSWNNIAEPGNSQHMAFHNHKRNLIAWDMYSPAYLCKYLDKESQKAVPAGYVGVGRFWGNSRGLLAIPEEITPEDLKHLMPEEIDEETGEVTQNSAIGYAIRIMGKHHEKVLKFSRWRSRARRGFTSYTLNRSGPVLRQILSYLRKNYEQRENVPF